MFLHFLQAHGCVRSQDKLVVYLSMCCKGLGEQICLAMKPGEMSESVSQESVKIWAIFFQMASTIGHPLGIHYYHKIIDSSLPMHPVPSLAGAQELVVISMELLFSTFLSLIC